jgi:muramidase (phage lysozyme)
MSAGTQGFTDTRQDTNHIGSVISRIIEARQLAEDERKYAEAQADKYQTSLEEAGVKRGDFFKKALRWKFGGEFKQKKLSQLNTWKKRGDLLKSAATGKSGRNKLNKIERSQALFDMFKASDKPKTFRDKFKPLYEGFVDDPAVKPKSELVKPGTAKKIQKAITTRSNKRVSKEDILDSLAGITQAIEKVAQSISEKNKIVSDQMIHSSVLQGMIHAELKSNGDSLDDKLQKIINAISNQTQYQTKAVSKAKSRDAENKLEAQKDAASVASFDDLTTKEDESKVPERPMGGYPDLSQMGHAGMDVSHLVPKAEQGAILSGPDSGYLAELHGNEMVVPLDNNYTQGEPSAVDGKVRPKPTDNIQKFEMGTNKSPVSSSPITSKFGFNTARNQMGIAGGGTTQQSKMTQTMVDVMSLPMMASGGTMLASTTEYMKNLGGEGADIKPEIERIARPIAKTFGLPPSIVNKAKQGSAGKSSGVGKTDEEGEEPSKNIFAKLMDGFGAMLDKMKDSINTTPPPPPDPPGSGNLIPGDAPPEIKALMETISGGEGGPNSVNEVGEVAGLSDMTIDQAIDKGLDLKSQGKSSGALGAYQMMPQYLRDRAVKAGFDPSKDKFSMENQTQIMRTFMVGLYGQTEQKLVEDLKAGKLESDVFPKLGQDSGWPSLPGGSQPNVHTAGAAGRYTTNVKKYEAAAAAQTPTPSPVQLGQAITNNYGLKVGQERTFNHPEYGEIKAHKTAVGFDFYDGPTKLDMSKPQGKSIVEYFTSTNGGDPDIIRQTNSNQFHEDLKRVTERANIIGSLSPGNKSESGTIAMLNNIISSQTSTAGSSPQPGEGGTPPGQNPLGSFAFNPYSTALT